MRTAAKSNSTVAQLVALGHNLGQDASRSPAPEALLQIIPGPGEILRDVLLPPRIRKALSAMVECERGEAGPWSVARFLSVPGFGLGSLLEIIRAAEKSRCDDEPQTGRSLEAELVPFLGKRPQSTAIDATPLLRQALEIIASIAPASEPAVWEALQAAGLSPRGLRLSHIERACRFLHTPLPFRVLRRGTYTLVVPSERAALAHQVQLLAMRTVTAWGAASLDNLLRQTGTEDNGFVIRVVSAREGFAWLDRALGWFWYLTTDSRFIRAVEKVLLEMPATSLDGLARRLSAHRPPEHALPASALANLIASVPQLRRWRAVAC